MIYENGTFKNGNIMLAIRRSVVYMQRSNKIRHRMYENIHEKIQGVFMENEFKYYIESIKWSSADFYS